MVRSRGKRGKASSLTSPLWRGEVRDEHSPRAKQKSYALGLHKGDPGRSFRLEKEWAYFFFGSVPTIK